MLAEEKCSGLIPIEEVARELKTTSVNVFMHIKRKRIVGHEIDGEWFVEAKSLDEFLVQSGGQRDTALVHRHCHKKGCGGSCH